MKDTKRKILATALRLFNERGLPTVTLRTIAGEMGISQGNLNYHFKKRSDIIEALYFQLVALIDEGMAKYFQAKVDLKMVFGMSAEVMGRFYAYRFFMLDFVQIMRANAVVKAHYAELSTLREAQFSNLFEQLVGCGLMRPAELPNEYLYLYKRLQILGDFWISSAVVTLPKLTEEAVAEYAVILNQGIFPYLTPQGVAEWRGILGDA